MKKIVSTLLVCVLLVGAMLALVSCGGPSGTYKDSITGLTSLEFDGGKVTISLGKLSTTANYEMDTDEEGNAVIVFSYEDGEDENDAFNGALPYSEGEEGDTKYIKIAGIKYNKVD